MLTCDIAAVAAKSLPLAASESESGEGLPGRTGNVINNSSHNVQGLV
jgi:hypothetical protein